MKSQVFLLDCMEGMKQYPDKYFDLAVVDPPYGIDKQLRGGRPFGTEYKKKGWDKAPESDYFNELFRVSKNQVIWGGNYFGLGRTRGFIVWDKKNDGRDFSECECTWTSFDKVARFFRMRFIGEKESDHPTEKPVALYSWIYSKYLPQGGKVLDTHLGSGSNRIAAYKAGNIDFTAFEIDKDYFEKQEERFRLYKSQLKLAI